MTKQRQHRLRDYILYVAISLLVLGACATAAISHVNQTLFLKCLAGGFASLSAFGFWIEKSRKIWRAKFFWHFTSAFVILHTIIWAVVFKYLASVELIGHWLAFAILLEALIVFRFLKWFAALDHHKN